MIKKGPKILPNLDNCEKEIELLQRFFLFTKSIDKNPRKLMEENIVKFEKIFFQTLGFEQNEEEIPARD